MINTLETTKLDITMENNSSGKHNEDRMLFDSSETSNKNGPREITNREGRFNGVLACPASILKRVRRNVDKENDITKVLSNTPHDDKNIYEKIPVKKKVKIGGSEHDALCNKIHLTGKYEKSVLNGLAPIQLDDDDDFVSPVVKRDVKNFRNVVPNCKKRTGTSQDYETGEEHNLRNNDTKDLKQEEDLHVPRIHTKLEDIEQNIDLYRGRILKEKTDKIRRRDKRGFDRWLLVRIQPKVLSDAVGSLSHNQIKWVKTTGFGSLLSFRMNRYPQGLSYYLAESFETHGNSLLFGNNNIPVLDEDVNEVLGLPRGKNVVQVIKNSYIEDRWREQFSPINGDGSKITANMICEAIKNSDQVDRMFKLNFLVLMCNVVIHGPSNPYVRQTILGFTGNLDNCSQYNWCRYLVDMLMASSLAWKENPRIKHFTGSIPFLVFLYLDRVVVGKRPVRRKKPTFIGWSDTLIHEREISDVFLKGFFKGKIAFPIRNKDSDDESSYEDNTWNKKENSSSDSEEVEGEYMKHVNRSNIKPDKSLVVVENNDTNNQEGFVLSGFKAAEDTRHVIDNLKESIDGCEILQDKCMMYLLSAKEIFKNNNIVCSLESKFLILIQKAQDFVQNELKNSDKSIPMKNLSEKSSAPCLELLSGTKSKQNSILNSPLDDDLCLSTQDCMFIDSCSAPKGNQHVSSKEVFTNMESQSKALSLIESNTSGGFKTPGSGSVFKVQLDATIPNFNIGVDEPGHVTSTSINHEVMKTQNNTHHIGRPVRDKKVSDAQKSPFIERFTRIHAKTYTKAESDLWDWLHTNKKYPNRALFRWGNMTCYKVDFQSMNDGEMVLTSAVDIWCCVLNSKEDLRSPISPHRLFCYIETTLGTLTGYSSKDIEKKYLVFEENMNHIMTCYQKRLIDVDLVFFPIFHINHYYVVCFNLKYPAIDILDNRQSDRNVKVLYGNQLSMLHKQFTTYLHKNNHPKSFSLSQMLPQRLVMQWQTKDNDIDCGIFAMRHMETYMGGGSRNWVSKLAPEGYTQRNQLKTLRLLFTYTMISSPLNYMYGVILDEIKEPWLLPEESPTKLSMLRKK